MGDEVVVRDVRPEDVDAIAEIAKVAWTPVFENYRRLVGDAIYEANWPDALENKANQVRRACAVGSPAQVRVVEVSGEVAAFVTFYLDVMPGEGEIGNNAVHPRFQGRGIAQRMYARVMDEMRAAGLKFVKVSTGLDDAHPPARRAYEKAGFDKSLPEITYYRAL